MNSKTIIVIGLILVIALGCAALYIRAQTDHRTEPTMQRDDSFEHASPELFKELRN